MPGAPKGNKFAAKERTWAQAIEHALVKRGQKLGRMGALVELAEVLLRQAESGDMAALKELGDRLDGKPHQTVTGEINATVRAYEPIPVAAREDIPGVDAAAGTADGSDP